MVDHRAQSEPLAPPASVEEAAAIVAAMEQFIRSTGTPAVAVEPDAGEWFRAAVLEGVEREPVVFARDPWINT
jgi:hypothetical protein